MASGSQHLSIVIEQPCALVYCYAAEPTNLPTWAAGLARTTVDRVDGQWVADSPMGRITIGFAERNDLGVLDHVVTLPSGESVYNPLRVIPYGDASEVVFTVRQRPGMTDEQFAADAAAVRADLISLKRILETTDTDPH
ncbi:hypothetical protein ABIB25_003069 [Nakamurella sp. UYEF19]|uniref:SRPBCC family protein n=1 Tax=Nakamurella sp. UYEF19 TaxID=1756392 RepID=UPI003391DCD3